MKTIAAALGALLMLSGCLGRSPDIPADKAFARSASALSGSDRYRIDGEVSIFDPHGLMTGQSRYKGEVNGHGKLNLQWSAGPALMAARAAEGPPAFQPLQLLDAMHNRAARVSYDNPPYTHDGVQLRIQLADKAARTRIAQGLRTELKALRAGMKGQRVDPGRRRQATQLLNTADRDLANALSSLKVNTVCLWTANPRTWFPRQMRENTELSYTWNGQSYREKRVSVTNFLPAG